MELHEQASAFLLQVRRAKWALETAETASDAASRHGVASRGGRAEAAAAHPWRVLRAELLHMVGRLYTYLALGAIEPEWADFARRSAEACNVDELRVAHETFARRVAERCLLRLPAHAEALAAVRRLLGMGLRLRQQLDALPRMDAHSHAAAAARWRAELRVTVTQLLEALRPPGERSEAHRSELLELARLIDFNGYYRPATTPASERAQMQAKLMRDALREAGVEVVI